jgi:phosphatidylglycerol:prolipoprotein diacylglycerol transferase
MSSHFVWDVDQVIFHIAGPFGLRWYSLLFLTGILLGNHFFISMIKKEGRSVEWADSLLYYIVFGTVIGARLGHVLFYGVESYLRDPIRILKVWEGGLASHGGYTGVIIAIYLFCRKNRGKFNFLWLTDRLTIVSIMAGGFIRLGNFFNSEIIGRVTDVPWAVVFSKVDSHPRHPSQLYESLGYFTVSIILYIVYRLYGRKPLEGRILGIGCFLGFTFRFFIEGLKENQEAFESMMVYNMGQLLSIPFILGGAFLAIGGQTAFFNREEA